MIQLPNFPYEAETLTALYDAAFSDPDPSCTAYLNHFEDVIKEYIRRDWFPLLSTLPEFHYGESEEIIIARKVKWEVDKGYYKRDRRTKDWDELTIRQKHLRCNARRMALIEDYDPEIQQVMIMEIRRALQGDPQARKAVLSWTDVPQAHDDTPEATKEKLDWLS